jgi:hypothetical protein
VKSASSVLNDFASIAASANWPCICALRAATICSSDHEYASEFVSGARIIDCSARRSNSLDLANDTSAL